MMRLGITLQEGYLIILAALIVLVGSGTVYGLWAEGRAKDATSALRLKIVNSRLRLGWWLAVTFTAAWWLGHGCMVMIFAVFSFFLLREFIALTPIKHTDHWVLVIAFYVAIPVQYALVYFDLQVFFTLFIPVYLFLLLPVVAALTRDTDLYLERIAKVQWGVMICVFCVSHAPAISNLDLYRYNSTGPLLLLFFLMVTFCSDLFSVIASSALGGRPMKLNPNKTDRGLAVGCLAGILIGLAIYWLTPFRLWQAGLYSLAIVIAGAMGDLVISAVKKSLGAKDHAAEFYIGRGNLERFAPLTFTAPAFYHLTVLFFLLLDL